MFCWSDYDLSVFYCIFGGGGERHIWMVPCADTATVTISEASIETATLHYGIGKANNRNDKIERWTPRTKRRTPHFPPFSDIVLSPGRFCCYWKRRPRRRGGHFSSIPDIPWCFNLLTFSLPSHSTVIMVYKGHVLWDARFFGITKGKVDWRHPYLCCAAEFTE